MTQRSRATLLSDQATNLADASNITAAELRAEIGDLTDSALITLTDHDDLLAQMKNHCEYCRDEIPAFQNGDVWIHENGTPCNAGWARDHNVVLSRGGCCGGNHDE